METVIIFRTFQPTEAQLVRSRLEAAGILANVVHEDAALAVTGAGVSAVEIRVEVGAAFAADALELIEDSEHAA